MARRKQGGLELVASLPWPVGIVLGLLAFFGVRYGIGWYLSSSHSPALSNMGRLLSAGAFAWIAWALLGVFWIAALVSYIGQRKRKGLLETQSGLDSLRAMSWREFEMLVGGQKGSGSFSLTHWIPACAGMTSKAKVLEATYSYSPPTSYSAWLIWPSEWVSPLPSARRTLPCVSRQHKPRIK